MFFGKRKLLQKLPEQDINNFFQNKKVLIVGGTAGIGRSLAIAAMNQGASLTIVGRRQPDSALEKAKFIQKDLSLMKNAVQVKPDPDTDIVVFTNGIICTPTRQETEEGIEKDLAVSFLSRLAITESFDKLKPTAKVFVMGYPGEKITPNLDDFNSEKEYKPFPAHMNTVVANESLVGYITSKYKLKAYGLNPGLIATDIRKEYLGNGILSKCLETVISWTNPSADSYAKTLLNVMASPELDSVPNQSFGQKGNFIDPNPFVVENGQKVIDVCRKLLEKALK